MGPVRELVSIYHLKCTFRIESLTLMTVVQCEANFLRKKYDLREQCINYSEFDKLKDTNRILLILSDRSNILFLFGHFNLSIIL